ncbi:MAG: DUF3810 family protein [Vicinamibacterales bacterium]
MVWRLGLVALAVTAALAPIPPDSIERLYSSGIYPELQNALTGLSNRTPVTLFDLSCVAIVMCWVGAFLWDVAKAPVMSWPKILLRLAGRTFVVAAVVYLAFVVTWGFNYRRPSLASRLGFDAESATGSQAVALAEAAVARLNTLYESAHQADARTGGVDPNLAEAFESAQSILGVERPAEPARPKTTLLDAYFRAAGVDGLTAPFFAETLVPSDLLDVERPVVIAHEWSHLAGFADEGEAGFVAWLTCLSGPALIEYSGWLSMLSDAVRVLPPGERERIMKDLDPGPVSDLRAVAARRIRNVNPTVSRAGWRVYDQYLRANRVESGTASYGEALQLALGTDLGRRSWQVRRQSSARDQSRDTLPTGVAGSSPRSRESPG